MITSALRQVPERGIIMQHIRKAFIINICIFLLEIVSLIWMMSGLSRGVLSAAGLRMLRYFTIDSNILMGIAALIAAIEEQAVIKGKKAEVPVTVWILKLAATASVTLTMLVTVFFLAPNSAAKAGFAGYMALFYNSNFFFHLFNPVLAIIVFVFFEKSDGIPFIHTFTGTIPLILYAVYYVAEALRHTENGKVMRGYDWYGFLVLGVRSAFVVLPLIFVITWGICFGFWKANKPKIRKK